MADRLSMPTSSVSCIETCQRADPTALLGGSATLLHVVDDALDVKARTTRAAVVIAGLSRSA